MTSNASALILYHTDGCHLCEIAQQILTDNGIKFELVDICDDAVLVARYGTTIPVLSCKAQIKQLGWPFDAEQVLTFIRSIR
ncbi:glutaredoxin family protein [Shewanella marina]|uniref:glutaredoxin family protein n=1 Tax=Shewanella marina TaxID=487319 RepID=UPI0004701124|nr:glutaredoxin family protein [Shewanella marina]